MDGAFGVKGENVLRAGSEGGDVLQVFYLGGLALDSNTVTEPVVSCVELKSQIYVSRYGLRWEGVKRESDESRYKSSYLECAPSENAAISCEGE